MGRDRGAIGLVGGTLRGLEVRVPVAGDQQAEVDALHGVAGRRPSPAYPWHPNVCRQRVRDAGKELAAFSPTGKDRLHDVAKLATLIVR